ncbi:MAG: DUF420 domain-containing protein [Deltaproteobacteria bacterium]|nr:DUF420 domain-containing protein [Deltaproteobacteria bacterium]
MDLAPALPTLNAILNGLSGLLLTAGFWAIKHRRIDLHRQLMLGAFTSSVLFLVSYLVRMSLTGVHRYPGAGASRLLYLGILASHTVLAVALVPLVLRTLQLSLLKRSFEAHKRIGRWTFPVWLYVSTSGVVVYLMLYHFAARS